MPEEERLDGKRILVLDGAAFAAQLRSLLADQSRDGR